MKKIITIITALALALVFVGCASAPSASSEMQNAKKKAPQYSLVGMATAQDAAGAEKAAKEQLARAMGAMVSEVLQMSVAAGEIKENAAANLAQTITTQLSNSDMSGAVKQGSGKAKGDVYWAVYSMEKAAVTAEVTRVVGIAKQLNSDDVMGFDILKFTRMDDEYMKVIAQNWSN